jgi:hypothetical protein
MIDETIPNGCLQEATSLGLAGDRARAKQARPRPTLFGLAGRVASLWARSRLKLCQVISPHVDGALTQTTSKGWSLTTARRLAQLTYQCISKRCPSDYPTGPNTLPGISRPIMDEFKDRLVPPTRGEQPASQLGPRGCRSSSIRRRITVARGGLSQGKMQG